MPAGYSHPQDVTKRQQCAARSNSKVCVVHKTKVEQNAPGQEACNSDTCSLPYRIDFKVKGSYVRLLRWPAPKAKVIAERSGCAQPATLCEHARVADA